MIDRSKLKSLLGNDEKMVQRFLDIFKTQTPQQLSDLTTSVSLKEWSKASITAHAIKSQCKYLGLDEVADHAYKIEQLTDDNKQLNLVPGLVDTLETKLLSIINGELT